MKAIDFFSPEDLKGIEHSIAAAELNTSGEIRMHLEDSCKIDVLDRAAFVFEKLNMHKTASRNGVLFYLSVRDRKFAVIGDVGINTKVPAGFWDEVKELVLRRFKEDKFKEGLSEGIHLAGMKLREHFPYHFEDQNELSNEISFN